mmetsp:Transcript_54520/g.147004  ORF Transcript_54520/g.147004 Transcript_54520/m.147004 type:complete len:203 (+) Transcript_54520:105-713(+)
MLQAKTRTPAFRHHFRVQQLTSQQRQQHIAEVAPACDFTSEPGAQISSPMLALSKVQLELVKNHRPCCHRMFSFFHVIPSTGNLWKATHIPTPASTLTNRARDPHPAVKPKCATCISDPVCILCCMLHFMAARFQSTTRYSNETASSSNRTDRCTNDRYILSCAHAPIWENRCGPIGGAEMSRMAVTSGMPCASPTSESGTM